MKPINRFVSSSGFFWVLLSSFLALAACNKNNAQSTSQKENNKSAEANLPVIEFRRTPCFGACPIYNAQITRDGNITYEGINFVTKTGKFTAKTDVVLVEDLLSRADNINFWQLDSLYATGATDFPSQVLTIRKDGKKKTISSEGEGPAELQNLMRSVDEVIMEALRNDAVPVKE